MSGEHDPGLFALVMLLRVHGIAVEGPEVSHRLGTVKIGISEMLRCAKEFGLKSRAVSTVRVRLARTPLPAIAALNDGGDHIWPQTAPWRRSMPPGKPNKVAAWTLRVRLCVLNPVAKH